MLLHFSLQYLERRFNVYIKRIVALMVLVSEVSFCGVYGQFHINLGECCLLC